jgi:rfaE bifunctional protein nucleotidyltransferase chain/domain
MKYRFAIIGLGRVGSVMMTLLTEVGHVPAWAISTRDMKVGAPIYRDIPRDPADAQVVFIALPDSHIRRIADEIASAWGSACKGVAFFHFSGLLTSDELSAVLDQGGEVASLHPLQSIADVSHARHTLKDSIFTIEGSEAAIRIAKDIVDSLGSNLISIPRDDKVLYHASATIASNYLVALLGQASEIMSSVGLSLAHLMPLIRGTLSNIDAQGSSALTGPISRGDWATVQSHIHALGKAFPDLVPSYVALGRYTARMAGREWPSELNHSDKLLELDPLMEVLNTERSRGMKVVFTNGCFDIIHSGHVSYLEKARSLGDCLVVGLNSDASARRIKGPDRPVNPEQARATVLSALTCVDHVAIFDQDTPYTLIERIRPDVLVKGGDWAVDDIVGADVVRSSGGKVLTLAFEPGFSTTGIIKKIKND